MSIRSSLVLLAFLFSTLAKAQSETATEGRNIAGYTPRISLCVVGLALYGLSGVIHWIHWKRNTNNRYMLTLTLGMTCMFVGFCIRIAQESNTDSLIVYILTTLFLLLSPCAFLATNYVLLTRLAQALDANSALFIRASLIVTIFVGADVFTFFLQASGGGLSATEGNADIGHTIALIGLGTQLAFFSLYCILLLVFGIRVRKMFPEYRQQTQRLRLGSYNPFATTPINDWQALWILMLVSSVGIIIRSVFRLIEYAGGYDGNLATTESYFYCLDALPLWLAMSLYCIFWPSRFIEGAKTLKREGQVVSSPASEEVKLDDWRKESV
ncbi:hypothetical protein JCM5353_005613 [Sporobolomyces roseus]